MRMESFSAALLAASAAPLRGWRCPRPNGAQPRLSQHRTGIAHRLPPRRPLATRQERPAAEDCNELAGFGKDPKIVVRPPRTVLAGDSEAIALHEALDELTSSQPPRPTTGLRGLAHTATTGYACADPVPAATSEDAWRMAQGTTTVISGPRRSIPIRRMTSPDSATSIAWPRGP
jgi:hypothetical protein